jgi:hypothetical protein
MRPSQLLIWGLYALALGAFAVAAFILLAFEAPRFDPLIQSWSAPPSVLAIGFVIYGAIVLVGARYLREFLVDEMKGKGGHGALAVHRQPSNES